MEKSLRILLLEDSEYDAELVKRTLLKAKMQCTFSLAMDKINFLKALDEFSPDVILSDNSLPQFNAAEALRITRERFIFIPFILVTGMVSEEYAATIITAGADDYILKDRLARLPTAIEAALKKRIAVKEITDYRYALDQVAIVAITDQKGIILYANENFCKISKYKVEELLGQDHRIINSGYHDKDYIRHLWSTIKQGNIWRGEFCNRAKDGTLYWVDSTIIPFLDEKGKPYQYLSIRNDITEKKMVEGELQTAYNRLSFHIENAPLGFIEWNSQLRVKSLSKRAEEIFGWTEKEFIELQKNGYSQVHEEDLPWVSNIAEQLIRGNLDRNTIQHRNYTKSGGVIWCEWFNSVLRDKDGRVETILSLVQDITERKKGEEDLRKSEIRLKEAQSIAHISNWEIDLEHNIHTWSDEFYRIYGLDSGIENPSQELFLSMIHPDDAGFAQEKMKEAFATLKDSSFQFRFIRSDRIMRHGCTEWKFEFDKKGKPKRLFGILQDITERVEGEKELRLLQFELLEQQRNEQLKLIATTLEAQEKERNAIGQELHDNVNQILVGTKLVLSIVKNIPEEYQNLVNSSMVNIQEAIDENRKIAHVLVAPDLDSKSLSEQIYDLADSMLRNSGIDVQIEPSGFREELLNDQQKLAIYRILQEQCTNIVKYAAAQQVNILLTTDDGFFKMIIADNGTGMETGKKTTGIGLRNIKARLSVFNGTAEITTAPGEGFTLEIAMPVADS